MPSYTLRHTMDKVRYFRDLLTTDERKVQIIVGTGIAPLLEMAVADYKDVTFNQICVLYQWDPKPTIIGHDPFHKTPPILIFVRWIQDPFLEALQEEYSDHDLVFFESDPTS